MLLSSQDWNINRHADSESLPAEVSDGSRHYLKLKCRLGDCKKLEYKPCMFHSAKEFVYFFPCPAILCEVKFNGEGLIKMLEKTLRQLKVQAMA